MLKKSLFCACLIVAVIAFVVPASASASSISCGFGSSKSIANPSNNCKTGPQQDSALDNVFDFGDYYLELNFLNGVTGGFTVTVEDNVLSAAHHLPGYTCIPFGANSTCIQFDVSIVADTQGASFNPPATATIAWAFASDALYPNGTTNRIRLFHDHLGVITDTTIAGS
jgi:hypothetical protein